MKLLSGICSPARRATAIVSASLSASPENSLLYLKPVRPLRMKNNRRFVELTAWLRPFTRWATRFSLNSPPWLPTVVRNAPLKLIALVLRCYHLALR